MLRLLFAEAVAHSLLDAHAVAFVQGHGRRLGAARRRPGAAARPARRRERSRRLRRGRRCVLRLLDPERQPAAQAVLGHRLPLVCVDEPRLDGVPFVGIDDHAAADAAAAHLARLGHRRVAIVVDRLRYDDRSGPADPSRKAAPTVVNARQRLAGYREALTAAGVAWSGLTTYEAPSSIASGGAKPLAARPRLTAILAASDALALGMLAAAAARGLRVHEQLSVVGFDDIPAAHAAGLTTIRQPSHDKGTARRPPAARPRERRHRRAAAPGRTDRAGHNRAATTLKITPTRDAHRRQASTNRPRTDSGAGASSLFPVDENDAPRRRGRCVARYCNGQWSSARPQARASSLLSAAGDGWPGRILDGAAPLAQRLSAGVAPGRRISELARQPAGRVLFERTQPRGTRR